VTLSGANFGVSQGSSSLKFNGVAATPSSWSNTVIVVPVPATATTGPVVVTVNGVASNGLSFTVSSGSGSLTTPWSDQDVGAPTVAGRASVTGGTFSVTGAGTDIWDVSDQFHFVYQPLTGDGEIVARVASVQNTDAWAKAGVMVRATLTGGSPNAVAQVTAGNGVTFQQRGAAGGASTYVQGPGRVAPQWVRLVRSGNTLTGYTSVDGAAWTVLSSTTIALPTQVFIGLSVTSHNSGTATTATFTNVTVTGAVPPAPSITSLSPTTGAVGTAVTISGANFGTTQGSSLVQFNGTVATPSNWSNTSIVVSVPTGAATGPVVATVNGVASNAVTFTVPVVVTAPSITSLSPTTGPVGTSVALSGANFGATQGSSAVQFNGVAATPSSWSNTVIMVPVPAGATTGSVVVTVSGVASNGLAFTVSSGSGNGTLTGPWSDQDVGAPAVAGGANVTGGTFSVTGAGTDIWDVTDQFHFVYQPLTGDGTIVARVASLQNTDGWAKAGVMVRATLTGGSANAVAQVTPGNGVTFQQRATAGAASTYVQGPGRAAPQWVRLVRSGNTLTGYTSVDGSTWTVLSSTTIALPTQVFVGLSVTSHKASTATTATFTNVTVTQP
jgi:regulation of enolase protein 1 (concanavalin A-like superfamily)